MIKAIRVEQDRHLESRTRITMSASRPKDQDHSPYANTQMRCEYRRTPVDPVEVRRKLTLADEVEWNCSPARDLSHVRLSRPVSLSQANVLRMSGDQRPLRCTSYAVRSIRLLGSSRADATEANRAGGATSRVPTRLPRKQLAAPTTAAAPARR